MRKSILVIRDDNGLSIHPEEGFITEETTIPVKDAEELILGILGLLGVNNKEIIISRKRRKK